MAYSWRSHYLIVSQDVNYPTQPVYSDDTGQMDGSLFLGVTKNLKLGIEATNILNATNRTYVQINGAGLEAIRGAFTQDRRYTFSARMLF